MTFTDRLNAGYTGEKGPLFGLAVKTALLTILTLGVYRFWAKTRIRKYIWSSIRLGGDTLEYTGTGLEKFLGFLVAVVVLAVYLGLVQLALFYFGLHFMFEPQTEAEILMQLGVIYATFFALVPLILFASYRARRYMLARTRLRGIRFGMDKAAWGYVWRAMGHGLLTILTLGILLPRQTFWLEKYKADRSYYGNQRFEQGGKWTRLYGAMKHIFIGIALIIAGGVVAALNSAGGAPSGVAALGFVAGAVGYAWAVVGYVYYNVHSFRYLTGEKTLAGAGFHAVPRTGKVIGTYLLGGLIVGVIVGVLFSVIGGITSAVLYSSVEGMLDDGSGLGSAIVFVPIVFYLVALAIANALALIFITQPIIAHFVETLTVLNPAALDAVTQRAHDVGADAEGFADALDIGAAI